MPRSIIGCCLSTVALFTNGSAFAHPRLMLWAPRTRRTDNSATATARLCMMSGRFTGSWFVHTSSVPPGAGKSWLVCKQRVGLHSVLHLVRAQLTLRVYGANYKKRAVNVFLKRRVSAQLSSCFLHPHLFSFFSFPLIFASGLNYD